MEIPIYYKGDIGRVIPFRTGFSWVGVTTKTVTILKPDGSTYLTKTGADVVVDDATTGQIHVLSKSGELNQVGEYLMQAKMEDGTNTLFSPITSFRVEEVLTAPA